MALHYRGDVDRFTDESGRFVSRARGMRSSTARREYEEEGIAQLLESFSKLSGLDIGEILESPEDATDLPDSAEDEDSGELSYDEPEDTEDAEFDMTNGISSMEEYLDERANELDIDPATESDPYSDV